MRNALFSHQQVYAHCAAFLAIHTFLTKSGILEPCATTEWQWQESAFNFGGFSHPKSEFIKNTNA